MYKKHFIKNYENGVSYLAFESTCTVFTITSLNISKKMTKNHKWILYIVVITTKFKSWVWWWLWMNAVQILDTC
jgi:hypothetical protein